LHPQEDLQQGLSTFMAERACMDEIASFAHKSHGPILLLIDEPYRGTVDLEASKRIYAFGKSIADMKYCIASIATHNQYPIELARDTNGAFANWHVHIEEIKSISSSFKRTYKIKPGPADWWFEDAEKRSKFIDWLAIGVRACKEQDK
jgi:DNA mismatch repair ATPase MutS